MADFTYNGTLTRPTFTLRWLSNNLTFNQVIAKPILTSIVNEWVLTQTLVQPTLAASIISSSFLTFNQTTNIPSLVAVVDAGQIYTFNKVISKPNLAAGIAVSNTYVFNQVLNTPTILSSIFSNNIYTFNQILRRPTLLANIINDIINSGTNTTYVLNTFNAAHSEYTNFGFNSYFKLGTKYYGVSSTGVFELTGATDNTVVIQAQVDTPVSSFDKQGLKACSDAILLGRLEGDVELLTVTDEQEERTNFTVVSDLRPGLHRIRTKIPKGLKGAVWQYKIKNVDGSQFAINNLEVFLAELQRIR